MKRILFNLILAAPLLAQQPPVASDPVPAPPRPVPAPRFVLPQQDPVLPLALNGGAAATFDPGARVGRPVPFRITVLGLTRLLDAPQIPEVEGLTFQTTGRSMTGDGAIVFNYVAIPSRVGRFVVPSFEFPAGGRNITIPQARVEVAEAQPGEARYQPLLASIDMPKRDFYVGETIPARILFIETPDESPTYVQHVAKTSGSVVFRVENMHRSVEVEVEGAKRRAIAKPVQITPMKEGPTEVNC